MARDVVNTDCPARQLLDHMASRWTVLVLRALADRPHRYHELRTEVAGVSDKMLAATLRTLAGDGLVRRRVGDGQPPEVTYSITDLGEGAVHALQPFLDWIRANADDLTAHWHVVG
ncbi:winged helix-turn-helix transcriptional regulator [Actinophytocola oryzae]|uniref:HxlR family transcriptional regulator n=1 Tax=Actinophytocola oryzae TaxID=502181 RepID=A0A4R7UUQ5_9PSEU|nr:helix-turn-helix domain-containing protein [Actinophytocola oryzae]TDV37754.1 HxlR family transcriptional regulator [Actinophytocola oryzae]